MQEEQQQQREKDLEQEQRGAPTRQLAVLGGVALGFVGGPVERIARGPVKGLRPHRCVRTDLAHQANSRPVLQVARW